MKEAGAGGLDSILCGGISGLITRTCISPLDVVKIRLQLQASRRGSVALYSGAFDAVRVIVREEGVRALWKGNVAASWLYVSYSAAQFWAYGGVSRAYDTAFASHASPSWVKPFVAGAGAGAFATAATYPFDLLRTRFAAAAGKSPTLPSTSPHGIIPVVGQIIRAEGVSGLYRGLTASVVQIVPYMGLVFGCYEPLRVLFGGWVGGLDGPSWFVGADTAIAGIVAAVVSKTGVFPLDTARKRLQVQGPTRAYAYVFKDIPEVEVASSGSGRGARWYTGGRTLRCIREIVKYEGPRALYRGLAVSLVKSAPSSAITLFTFEQSTRLLRHLRGDTEPDLTPAT
ncbi:mitochondrial thiamine pyrophosphate transporter [Savitreella phatthalungensis]